MGAIGYKLYQCGRHAVKSFRKIFPFQCVGISCGGHFWSLNPCSSHDLKFKSSHDDADATLLSIPSHPQPFDRAPIARPAGKARKAAKSFLEKPQTFQLFSQQWKKNASRKVKCWQIGKPLANPSICRVVVYNDVGPLLSLLALLATCFKGFYFH